MTGHRLGLTRVAFGCATIDDIGVHMAAVARGEGNARHGRISSRRFPRRDLSGGSLYWIIRHMLVARQPILGVEQAHDGDGSVAIIRLDLPVVPVRPRPCRAHQGWRYLAEPDWPADLADAEALVDGLPPALESELAALGLV